MNYFWPKPPPMFRRGCVYILTNTHHTVLYTGVTSNLPKRIQQHINNFYPKSFSRRYNVKKLVYYKVYDSIKEAILVEKKIKGGSRAKKLTLINELNPQWRDLYEEVSQW